MIIIIIIIIIIIHTVLLASLQGVMLLHVAHADIDATQAAGSKFNPILAGN